MALIHLSATLLGRDSRHLQYSHRMRTARLHHEALDFLHKPTCRTRERLYGCWNRYSCGVAWRFANLSWPSISVSMGPEMYPMHCETYQAWQSIQETLYIAHRHVSDSAKQRSRIRSVVIPSRHTDCQVADEARYWRKSAPITSQTQRLRNCFTIQTCF